MSSPGSHSCTASLAFALVALTACQGQREEGALIDTRDNVLEQGQIDCSERADTGYTSGNAFTITVVTVDGKPVEVATADAYYLMQQAAAADGVVIRIVSGFRTMDEQEYLYGCYVNCSCNSCNLAASPGYSNHQSGHALDLNTSDSGVLSWLNNHGGAYGFERTVPSEAWHWEWWGGGPGGGPCANAAPRGYLDAVSCDGAFGWAQDPDSPDAPIAVHVYVDGPAGSGRGFPIVADLDRADLCSAIGSCVHGYAWTIPPVYLDDQPHSVHAYAIDSEGGNNPLLSGSPLTFTCAAPKPALDESEGVKRHVTSPDVLSAWALGFDDVYTLSDAQVAAYQSAASWPGAPRLVRAAAAPAIYVVDDDESLRHVTSPAAMAAWGFDFALVEELPAADIAARVVGPALPDVPFLFRAAGPEVYMLDARPDLSAGEGEGEGEGDPGDPTITPVASNGRGKRPLPPSVDSGCAQTSTANGVTLALTLLALLGLRRVIERATLRRRRRLAAGARAISARGQRARVTPGFVLGAMVVVVVAASGGCLNELEADTEDQPIDTRDNETLQGVYDCSETSNTGYRSGNSFPIDVVTVDGRKVEVKTANAYIAMQARAKTQGVTIRVVSGFRTNAEQQYLYGCYVNCSCNSCNLAARPGYSNHQSGHALDLNTSDAGVLSWLNAHGDEYGFARTVPSESWHWEFWNAINFSGPCGGPQLPQPCTSGDFDGAFCDDDGDGSEQSHDRLQTELGVNFHCSDIAGAPAYCGAREVTRAQSMFVLGKAAGMPTAGHPNAFVDDNGHANEKYMNAAKAFGILLGSNGAGNPDGKATRDTLAVMLNRQYLLPPADRDYFDDDDGAAHEDDHNRVAAAGLFGGYADANGGRKDFRPTAKANRSTLAILAVRAADRALIPVWDIPQACIDGSFTGHFCDDDGTAAEAMNDRLIDEAGLTGMACSELAGSPRFCADKEASRALAIVILGGSAGMPLSGHPDGFVDDDDHPREAYLDAAKAYGIITGYQGGTEARPSIIAARDTLATILARMYALPESDVDFFSDDDGTAVEALHNKVGAAGLFAGVADGNGGRAFRGSRPATKGQLATLAQRARDAALVPVWALAAAPTPPAEEEPPVDEPDAIDEPAADVDDIDEPDATIDDPAVAPSPDDPVDVDESAPDGPPPGLGDGQPRPSVEGGNCSTLGEAPLVALLSLLPVLGAVAGRRRARAERRARLRRCASAR